MRQNWLSNRIFRFFDVIVDHCCFAWNTLIDQPWKIMSFARRDCAVVGDSSRGLVLELSARDEVPAAWTGLAASSTSCAASMSPTTRARELRGRDPVTPEQPRLLDDVARPSQAGVAEFPESLEFDPANPVVMNKLELLNSIYRYCSACRVSLKLGCNSRRLTGVPYAAFTEPAKHQAISYDLALIAHRDWAKRAVPDARCQVSMPRR